MTILRPETTILAAALCDLPDADAAVQQRLGAELVRALRLATPSEGYAESVAAGHYETDLDAWAADVALKTKATAAVRADRAHARDDADRDDLLAALGLTDHDHARGNRS